jgi:pantoate--beta-alanine ligase
MHVVHTVAELREKVMAWKGQGLSMALIPTMGNLHAGHLRLVETGLRRADRTVVSIFVNPIQFGPGEDFARYPRTLEADGRQLARMGTDLIFAPSESDMYPHGREATTKVAVPDLSDILCGVARPGHFRGVATVVVKLLNLVQPDIAVFGEKDFQQLVIIRRVVEDLNMAVDIIGIPTVREPDGLALSSRNRYLSPGERAVAPALYRTLKAVAERVQAGGPDPATYEAEAMEALRRVGFDPEYVAIRRADDLTRPASLEPPLVVLAAARLGQARLIDNLCIR